MNDMKPYMGSKMILAKPMSYAEYARFEDKEYNNDDELVEGYMVMYPDKYISWCPIESFELSYRQITENEMAMITGEEGTQEEVKDCESDLEDKLTYTFKSDKETDTAGIPMGGFNFGVAVELLKCGKRVARMNWKDDGQYLFLAHSISFSTPQNMEEFVGKEDVKTQLAIGMKTSENRILIGWLASQTDILAEDWYEYED